MARKSARILGQDLGLNAHQVNLALEHLGLIVKSRYVTHEGYSLWDLTEEGKKYGQPSKNPYASGHIWDDIVADMIREMFSNSDWRP